MHAVLVLELDVEQLRHEIVGGVLRSPGDVVGDEVASGAESRGGRRRQLIAVAFDLEELVELVAEELLVVFGDAEQHPDGAHGHLRTQVGDEVEAAGTHHRIEAPCAELAHLGLEGVHLLRREDSRHQSPVHTVQRRVFHEEQTRWQLDACLDDLEHRSAVRPVAIPVDQPLVHVGEPAQRVEVVALVVVERRLVPHPLPERVRVLVDLDVERVVVEVVARGRHRAPFRRAHPGCSIHDDDCNDNVASAMTPYKRAGYERAGRVVT
jgi:hypothetical protein